METKSRMVAAKGERGEKGVLFNGTVSVVQGRRVLA
jgi:hypothetical protein